jgi:cellulose synthase operon protein C
VKMPCDDLDTFVDGELPDDDAQAFRDHLAFCGRCQSALRGRMLEAVVMGHGDEGCACPSGPRRFLIPFPSRHRAQWVMLTAGVAAAAMLVLVLRPPGPEPTAIAQISLAAKRNVEVRFSPAELDGYRPRDIVRSAGPTESRHEDIATAIVADLERQGRANAYVAALALKGDMSSARAAAAKLPNTAQSLSDRAALELLRVDESREPGLRATQQQAAEQALSLAAAALVVDPSCMQAKWNRAVALRRLQLPRAAADAFEEIAARGEPGWSDEARDTAARLRKAFEDQSNLQDELKREADGMIAGGPPISNDRALFAPSQARRALHVAIATASTVERLDALRPLARTLDGSASALVELVQRIRGSSTLAHRAPIAQSLDQLIRKSAGKAMPMDELRAIRARAQRAGFPDIALATFLVQFDRDTDDRDLASLEELAAKQDAWWRIFAIMRRTYALQYKKRDYLRAEQVARSAAGLCQSAPTLWCERITMFAGAANAELGRMDTALELVGLARQMARQPATRDDEAFALNVTGQLTVFRVQPAIDSVAVADAYFTEYALRIGTCDAKLLRLDALGSAALDRHRHAQAFEYRVKADELEAGECKSVPLGLNGETVRLRLALTGREDVAKLRDKVRVLEQEAEHRDSQTKYIRSLRAATIVGVDRQRGEAALHSVIADADQHPDEPYASHARSIAYSTLIEVAAQAREADNVIALLARRLKVEAPARCAVGITQWNRVVVAVRGNDGSSAIESRGVPDGRLMVSPSELVPAALRQRLAACRRVDVLATGPYFGMASILGPDIPWVYKSHSGAGQARSDRELVITDVVPPEDTGLPELRSFRGSSAAVVLSGAKATPGAALDNMKTAGLIIIAAHGFTDTREPSAASLVLSPDDKGDYLLTAAKVSTAHLDNAPVVVLAGCEVGRVQVGAEPWSLATSFLAAGARAVIAPTEKIPDDEASVAFDSLVSRIRSGMEPVDALQAERADRGHQAAWLSSIVVFE